MSHPLQAQVLERLSRSTGHAVGWRPLAQRAVLSVMLGLSLVSAFQPAFAQTPIVPQGQQQFEQVSQVARWWGSGGIGFSQERFKADLMARGYSPAQAISAYQWMDHLASPTFGHPHGEGWTAQGLHDRAEYASSLSQALDAGPVQFDAWQAATIHDFKQLLDGLADTDTARIQQVHEYSDALGILPQSMQQLAQEGRWGNEKFTWAGVDRVIDNDRDARTFDASIDMSLTLDQARAHLDQAVQDTGLRWFRAPVSMMQDAQDIQGLADMLHAANAQVQHQTGMTGPALGLNGRVSWDMMTLPDGSTEGITNEHAGGIAIRGTPGIMFHEFTHALGAAMNQDVGTQTIDGTMGQLFDAIEAMELPYSEQIHSERWDALMDMAKDMGMQPGQADWLMTDTANMSREDMRAKLLSQGQTPLNASYLSANVQILNEQAKEHQTLAFVHYRNAVLTMVAADDVGLPADYLLDIEETVAYQAQYRVAGTDPIDTWQTPTPSEMKLQDGLWEAYYAKARAWQQADLGASVATEEVQSPASFQDKLAARRAVVQADLAPSIPRLSR